MLILNGFIVAFSEQIPYYHVLQSWSWFPTIFTQRNMPRSSYTHKIHWSPSWTSEVHTPTTTFSKILLISLENVHSTGTIRLHLHQFLKISWRHTNHTFPDLQTTVYLFSHCILFSLTIVHYKVRDNLLEQCFYCHIVNTCILSLLHISDVSVGILFLLLIFLL